MAQTLRWLTFLFSFQYETTKMTFRQMKLLTKDKMEL